MRVVLSANESIGHDCLKILLEEKQEVVGIVTDKTTPETKLRNARMKSLARQVGTKVYEADDINDSDFLEELRGLAPDVLFNIAFLHLYKKPILGIPKMGCVNFHPGPLPKYGGSNGWVWAIINGDTEYGVTFHQMKERIDAGDILGLERFPIEKDETGLSLLMKCYKHGADLFRRTLRGMANGGGAPIPQDLAERSYYYKKTVPFEGMIDVKWSSGRIYDFVRAMSFAPFQNPLSPPMISFKDTKLVIAKARIMEEPISGNPNPGEVVDISQEGVAMQTGGGLVRLRLLDNATRSDDTIMLCQTKGISKGTILG